MSLSIFLSSSRYIFFLLRRRITAISRLMDAISYFANSGAVFIVNSSGIILYVHNLRRLAEVVVGNAGAYGPFAAGGLEPEPVGRLSAAGRGQNRQEKNEKHEDEEGRAGAAARCASVRANIGRGHQSSGLGISSCYPLPLDLFQAGMSWSTNPDR